MKTQNRNSSFLNKIIFGLAGLLLLALVVLLCRYSTHQLMANLLWS